MKSIAACLGATFVWVLVGPGVLAAQQGEPSGVCEVDANPAAVFGDAKMTAALLDRLHEVVPDANVDLLLGYIVARPVEPEAMSSDRTRAMVTLCGRDA